MSAVILLFHTFPPAALAADPTSGTTLALACEKSPLAAGAMSFLMPGLGQFYNGRTEKGLVHFLVFTTSFATTAIASGIDSEESDGEDWAIVPLVAVIGMWVYSTWDAQAESKAINREARARVTVGVGTMPGPLGDASGISVAKAALVFGF